MEKYIAPEIEVINFDNSDIVTTSFGDDGEGNYSTDMSGFFGNGAW